MCLKPGKFFFIHSLTYVIYRLKMTTATTVNTTTTIPITHGNTGYDPPQQGFFYITFIGGWRCVASPAPGMETAGPKGTGIAGDMRHNTSCVSVMFFFFFLYNIHAGPTLQMARDTRLNASHVPGTFFIILLLNMLLGINLCMKRGLRHVATHLEPI